MPASRISAPPTPLVLPYAGPLRGGAEPLPQVPAAGHVGVHPPGERLVQALPVAPAVDAFLSCGFPHPCLGIVPRGEQARAGAAGDRGPAAVLLAALADPVAVDCTERLEAESDRAQGGLPVLVRVGRVAERPVAGIERDDHAGVLAVAGVCFREAVAADVLRL